MTGAGSPAGALALRYVGAADSWRTLPDSPAEVALLGRSNVGKSSLLNALAGRTDLARTSKTPGRTRLLQCFALGAEPGAPTVLDCPGYGYAQVSKAERAALQSMVDQYLQHREALAMAAVLVDGEIGPTTLDLQLLEFLREAAVPHSVVATKADKVKAAARERRKREVAAACQLERADVTWVSAAKGTNLDRLRQLVRLWLDLG